MSFTLLGTIGTYMCMLFAYSYGHSTYTTCTQTHQMKLSFKKSFHWDNQRPLKILRGQNCALERSHASQWQSDLECHLAPQSKVLYFQALKLGKKLPPIRCSIDLELFLLHQLEGWEKAHKKPCWSGSCTYHSWSIMTFQEAAQLQPYFMCQEYLTYSIMYLGGSVHKFVHITAAFEEK